MPNKFVKHLWKSQTPNGHQMKTFVVKFPKSLLAQLNTHRQLCRNVGSSRAVPFAKMAKKVELDPFIPTFTLNQKGMQGVLTSPDIQENLEKWWLELSHLVIDYLEKCPYEVHKQTLNRPLEWAAYTEVILSGTEWENFYHLRASHETQPEFFEIAKEMLEVDSQTPSRQLNYGEWHIPFLTQSDFLLDFQEQVAKAVACCARVSYLNHLGEYSKEKDAELISNLLESGHKSPFEHVAQAVEPASLTYLPKALEGCVALFHDEVIYTRQYKGFYTLRSQLEDELCEVYHG